MQRNEAEDQVLTANLSHRVRNLEQENEVLRRYLANVPVDIDTILELEHEIERTERLIALRRRVARINSRIDCFVTG